MRSASRVVTNQVSRIDIHTHIPYRVAEAVQLEKMGGSNVDVRFRVFEEYLRTLIQAPEPHKSSNNARPFPDRVTPPQQHLLLPLQSPARRSHLPLVESPPPPPSSHFIPSPLLIHYQVRAIVCSNLCCITFPPTHLFILFYRQHGQGWYVYLEELAPPRPRIRVDARQASAT